jgi:hypothetical protein
MARYTSAYKSFLNRLGEIEILRGAAAQKEKQCPISLRKEINALCRGAIVLLCGHLEAYVKELGEVALDTFYTKRVPRTSISSRVYYHISKDVLDEIQSTTDGEKIAEKMFAFLENDISFWSRNGPFPQQISAERFNKGFSNPGFEKIRTYFNRFGYQQYKSDLGRLLKAQYNPTINMVDHVVDIRNKIAHGDPAATKTPSEVKDMVKLVRFYCMSTDRVFASWCGKTICKIR